MTKSMGIIEKAYEKAIAVLRACRRPAGFHASGLPGGYEAVWARDSMITSLGASLAGKEFKTPFRRSLELLSRHQDDLGLIPNCVGSYNLERESDVTFNSIDAPLWYIIGHYVYALAYRDAALLLKYRAHIAKALLWLRYQDPNSDGVIVQQPTGDWQDAFPHKYGRVISTQALYYAALRFTDDARRADYVKAAVNGRIKKYLAFFDHDLGYYRPWIWKDHDGDRETENWFDSFGNIMAIVTGLAGKKQAESILNHIAAARIDRPAPVKAIYPPLRPNGPEWRSYFEKCNARAPYQYLNGGVWPFIGGFYVAALVRLKKYAWAEKNLEKLAAANMKIITNPDYPAYIIIKGRRLSGKKLAAARQKEFNEWLDGRTGEPQGEPYQAWSAGTYIYAYECLRRRRVLYFD